MIKTLSEQITEDLCAQQVITNICDCIKQLIDNSIDANSTQIKIQLEQYGKKSITVTDNGIGLSSFQFLGKKGSTSKNKGNYREINTLGFRGEALHSLGKISQHMMIISTVEGQNKNTIKFDVKSQQQQVISTIREHGTIVEIKEIFEYLPVRRYELLNKYKQFLKKIDEMIKQYCLIYPQIAFIFVNRKEGKEDLLIQTNAYPKSNTNDMEKQWFSRIIQILGNKIGQCLIYMKTSMLQGWLLGKIQSGSSKESNHIRKNIRYMYLNRRPIDPIPKIANILDSYYRKFNKSTKYLFIINIILPSSTYDINLTPNKRQILIRQQLQNKIITQLMQYIEKNLIEDIPVLQDYENKKKCQGIINFFNSQKGQNHIIQQKSEHFNKLTQNSNSIGIIEVEKQKYNGQLGEFLKNNKISKNGCKINKTKTQLNKLNIHQMQKQKVTNINKRNIIQQLNERMTMGTTNYKKSSITTNTIGVNNIVKQIEISQQQIIQKQHCNSQNLNDNKNNNHITFSEKQNKRTTVEQQPISQSSNKEISNKYQLQPQLDQHSKTNCKLQFQQGITKKTQKKECQQIFLEKTKHNLPKEAFKQFKILGQFNHGFIVCEYLQNLYLIDQHAASQKYNFQKIINGTRNRSQIYHHINCNTIDIQNIQQHRNSLENDGYKFDINEEGTQVCLNEAPLFMEKVYGQEYFMELASSKISLSNHPHFYLAAATKSCKMAVMIGDVLQLPQMKNILRQLAELNSPWNCPHGRPTLIYLNSFNQINKKLRCQYKQYSLQ